MRYILTTALLLAGVSWAEECEEGFVSLFNGKDLTGWEGDTKLWLVEDGMLIGRSPGMLLNKFLATTKEFADFVLRFEIQLVDNKGNSGVQFRSKRVPDSHEVSGFQADVGEEYWGTLYDESRRNRPLVTPKPEDLKKALKPTDWNKYEVRAVGNEISLIINGATLVEYTEDDPAIPRSGIIAPQIHGGPAMEVRFRNIRIKEVK